MATAQAAGIVHLMLEKVRKKLPLLYERTDSLFSLIQKRDVEKVSTRNARIPLQVAPGGNFGFASLDGGDMGRGSITQYDHAELTPAGLKFAVEINKLIEYATNSTEKAVADATKKEVGNAMKQFRRDLDAQLQTAGNAVMGNVSATVALVGGLVTLDNVPFGARLFRVGQRVQFYSFNLATNRNAVAPTVSTITQVSSDLGKTQTITVDNVPAGVVSGGANPDVIVAEGLTGASPVGLYGIPYHHSNAITGFWLNIDRSATTYSRAVLVDAQSAGFAMPQARLAVDNIMQNLGMDEFEAMKMLRWYGNRAQRAAMHEIAFSLSTIDKKGADQSFDLGFKGETLLGIQTMWNIHANPSRLDLLNLDTWGRVEWKEIDYLELGNNTVFPVYGASGGVAAAYLFYFVCGMQYFIDNPKAVSSIINLALPTGY